MMVFLCVVDTSVSCCGCCVLLTRGFRIFVCCRHRGFMLLLLCVVAREYHVVECCLNEAFMLLTQGFHVVVVCC